MKAKFVLSVLLGVVCLLVKPEVSCAQQSWQAEWDKTVAAAKREGKVVVGAAAERGAAPGA